MEKKRQFNLNVLPETRDALRRYAFEHGCTASSLVDRLTAEFLDALAAQDKKKTA